MPQSSLAPDETRLEPGTRILAGGRMVTVPDDVCRQFQPGDRLLSLEATGDILRIPAAQQEIVSQAVGLAAQAFERMDAVPDSAIDNFFEQFACRLGDEWAWGRIAGANAGDVEAARSRGRSTTRLIATAKMRENMIDGLRGWRQAPASRGRVLETVQHEGWRVEQVVCGYGVVGFVFEGRPNVFADATGVLRGGNTAVLRIGSDALGTARAIAQHALIPALAAAGLPEGAVSLVDSPERSAGWAMFSDPRVGLAVARGSGPAVDQLGAVARQAGIPVSLHGTGGAWIVADETADAEKLRLAVFHSVDRKRCNTLNVACLPRARAAELVPALLAALQDRSEELGHGYRIHVVAGGEPCVPEDLFHRTIEALRAEGKSEEPIADTLPADQVGREWEWEGTPEIALVMVSDTDEAINLFNRYSPRLVASLLSENPGAHDRFFRAIHAPFIGNGFTRWVDGQFALGRPELGLSNWQAGRLLGRGAILTGDSVFTIKLRTVQSDFAACQAV